MKEDQTKQTVLEDVSPHFLRDFILGGITAGISKTVVAPLERVKLILQTQPSNCSLTDSLFYKGTLDILRKVPKAEGILSLWRGNLANILRYVPSQALIFGFKDTLRHQICTVESNQQNPWRLFAENFLSSSIAGSLSLLFVYPLDFVRTRLATDMGRSISERQFAGFLDCSSKIYQSDGIKGLYRGFFMSMQGIAIYRGVAFGGYDTLKITLLGSDSGVCIRFGVAQAANIVAGFISYPWDTVTRRMMMQSGRPEKLYTGSLDCFKKTFREEGIYTFFKGFTSNILRCSGGALVLVLYDELQHWLLGRRYSP